MNKKGISDLFMLMVQLIALGLIFALLMFKAQEVDIHGIHRNIVSKDLGLTLTTISFFPEHITYRHLTKDDENFVSWREFYVELNKNTLSYYETLPTPEQSTLKPGRYAFLSNKLINYKIPDLLKVSENSFTIEKSEKIIINTSRGIKNLNKIPCGTIKENYIFKSLNYCDRLDNQKNLQFCDELGNKFPVKEEDFTIVYDGFEKKYLIQNKEFFIGRGLEHEDKFETQIIDEIVDSITQKDSKNIIYLTLNDDEKNNFIIKLPITKFQENYNLGCTIYNTLLDTRIKIDGMVIMPSDQDKIIIELGSIKHDNNHEDIKQKIQEINQNG